MTPSVEAVERMPLIGTFLHPVGLSYCAEVLAVFPPSHQGRGLCRVQFRRWGWKDGQPFDDGYREPQCGVSLRPRGPGVWSSPSHYSRDFRYGSELWRVAPAPGGQLGLFA